MTAYRGWRRSTYRLAATTGLYLAAAATVAAPATAQVPATAAAGATTADRGETAAEVLTVGEAVALALERNRDLANARFVLDGAESQVDEAWGSVFPRVDLTSSYMRNLTVPSTFLPAIIFDPSAGPDDLIPVQFGAENNWSLQIRLEQPIFQAQAFIGVGAAARYRRLQREVLRGTAEAVATRARIAYHDVLLAKERVRLNEQTVERIRRTLEEARAMRRAGLTSEYDVLRLEVQLANVEPELRRARNTHAAAVRNLAVELGMEPTDTIDVAGSLLDVEPEPVAGAGSPADGIARFAGPDDAESMPVEQIVELAIERRSDLRQLRLTEELRTAELRVAQVEYLPEVSLFGTYSINTQEDGRLDFFGGTESPRAYGRQIGVQVSVPLFSGLQRPARVGQRRAALQQARVQYGGARARAESEVKTLAEQVGEASDRAAAQRLAVEQARRGYDIATARYREGVGSRLEVTDAEVALRQSEFNYAQAVYDYLTARARLDRAVGTVPLVDTETEAGLLPLMRTTQ